MVLVYTVIQSLAVNLLQNLNQIGLIDQLPKNSWANDSGLVQEFIKDLVSSKNLHYLHFLGGETLITPAFRTILQGLVDANVAAGITIGLTTNLTVWDSGLIDLMRKFKQVHAGLSIETLTTLNELCSISCEHRHS